MKNSQFAILIATLVLCTAIFAVAQSYGSIGWATIAPAVSNCPTGLANGTTLCTVGTSSSNYAVYVSFNAAPYQLLVPASGATGVTSFNGRTGVVTLTKGDVTGTGLGVASATTSALQ